MGGVGATHQSTLLPWWGMSNDHRESVEINKAIWESKHATQYRLRKKILDGYINIDKYPSNDSVIFGDLEAGLPLEDSCASTILLDNVIEHVLSVEQAMSEIYRLLKPNGEVTIITPHFSSASSWQDPTHRHHLSYFSFDYFSRKKNYLGNASFITVKKKLSFGGGISLVGKLIFSLSPEEYEKKFCFIFRASTLTVTLRKI